jgi:hypothetical protein
MGQSATIQGLQVTIRGQSGVTWAAGYTHSARESDIKRSMNVVQRIGPLSSSEGSDNERCEKRESVIASPVDLSDTNEDGVSPSQHKSAMARQMAYISVVLNLTSGSDEEEEEEEGEEQQSILQSIDDRSGTPAKAKST